MEWFYWIMDFFKPKIENERSKKQRCDRPDCIRCRKSEEILRRADHLFSTFFQKSDRTFLRIRSALDTKLEPYIFYVENLERTPVWNLDDEKFPPWLRKNVEILEENWSVFDREFSRRRDEFSLNEISKERHWSTLSFFNQGRWHEHDENSGKCVEVLKKLSRLLDGCVFGNAFFSVLTPGSKIETHVGPTSIRIRCHLALRVPEGRCEIFVDHCPYAWRPGKCFIFDDSFSHSVSYEKADFHQEDRCVLVIDFWHPNLLDSEIDCMRSIFPA